MKMKKAKRNMAIGYVIVMIPLLVLPLLIQSRADMGLINNALLLYIVSLGLNISLGLTGMSNLCQAAFWGTGAYTAAILVTKFGLPFLVVVPVSVIVTAFVSMLLGLLSTRIKGIYFAILTIGFALFFTIFPPSPAGRVWILSPCSCCLNTAAGALIPRRSKKPAAIAVEHKRDSLKWRQCLDWKQPGIAFERTQYSDRSFSKRAPNTQRG